MYYDVLRAKSFSLEKYLILAGGSKNKIRNWQLYLPLGFNGLRFVLHKKDENMKYEPRLCCFIYLGLIVLKFYSFALVYVLAKIYLAGGHHLICGGHDILCGGHYIAKLWPRNTMWWPLHSKVVATTCYVVATASYVVAMT